MSTITEYVKKGENLADVLKKMLEEECVFEKSKAERELSEGALEEKLDDIDRTYEFNKEKFHYVNLISNSDVMVQKKFLTALMYIDMCDFSIYNQVTTILTLATMFGKFGAKLAENFDTKDLCFLATAMVSIPLEKYESYGYMISRNITKIMNKTNDEEHQRNICYAIFDYCDLFVEESATNNELDSFLDDIDVLIDSYRVNTKPKSGKL